MSQLQRLTPEEFAEIHLDTGSHAGSQDGFCAMELASFVAGEPWSESPNCVNPVISRAMLNFNDTVGDADRQLLKPYILRSIRTADPQYDKKRFLMTMNWIVKTYLSEWFRHAGLIGGVNAIYLLPEITNENIREVVSALVNIKKIASDYAIKITDSYAWIETDGHRFKTVNSARTIHSGIAVQAHWFFDTEPSTDFSYMQDIVSHIVRDILIGDSAPAINEWLIEICCDHRPVDNIVMKELVMAISNFNGSIRAAMKASIKDTEEILVKEFFIILDRLIAVTEKTTQ